MDIEQYLIDISQYSLLTAEEEISLTKRVNMGDKKAREKMVNSNLRLVVNIAKYHARKQCGLQLMDMIEDGNVGLIRAVEKFDTKYKIRFSTYASYWIEQSIRRGISMNGKTIKIPAHLYPEIARWYKIQSEFYSEGKLHPTPEEIIKKGKFSKKQAILIQRALKLQPAEHIYDANGKELLNYDKIAPTIESYSDENAIITHCLNKIAPREALVLKMRFGLLDRVYTLEEVGAILGVTRERVRQLQTKATDRMRFWLAKYGIDNQYTS